MGRISRSEHNSTSEHNRTSCITVLRGGNYLLRSKLDINKALISCLIDCRENKTILIVLANQNKGDKSKRANRSLIWKHGKSSAGNSTDQGKLVLALYTLGNQCIYSPQFLYHGWALHCKLLKFTVPRFSSSVGRLWKTSHWSIFAWRNF